MNYQLMKIETKIKKNMNKFIRDLKIRLILMDETSVVIFLMILCIALNFIALYYDINIVLCPILGIVPSYILYIIYKKYIQ